MDKKTKINLIIIFALSVFLTLFLIDVVSVKLFPVTALDITGRGVVIRGIPEIRHTFNLYVKFLPVILPAIYYLFTNKK